MLFHECKVACRNRTISLIFYCFDTVLLCHLFWLFLDSCHIITSQDGSVRMCYQLKLSTTRNPKSSTLMLIVLKTSIYLQVILFLQKDQKKFYSTQKLNKPWEFHRTQNPFSALFHLLTPLMLMQTFPPHFKTPAPSAIHFYSWEYSTPHRASTVRKTLRLLPKCTQACISSKIPFLYLVLVQFLLQWFWQCPHSFSEVEN